MKLGDKVGSLAEVNGHRTIEPSCKGRNRLLLLFLGRRATSKDTMTGVCPCVLRQGGDQRVCNPSAPTPLTCVPCDPLDHAV